MQTASARSGDLELTVAVAATVLAVGLTNRSTSPLRIYFAAEGPQARHHDFLTAELAGENGTRTLRFTGDRNASTSGLVELAPGQGVNDDLDLPFWAREPINDEMPLAPGRYAVSVTYRVDQPEVWTGAITAGPVHLQMD